MLRHSYFETLVREPVSREADVYRLLTSFEVAVSNGEPLSFATFKDLWQARHFSLIFEANNSPSLHQPFVQSLFAAAVDGLLRDLRPVTPPVRLQCQYATPSSIVRIASDAQRSAAVEGSAVPSIPHVEIEDAGAAAEATLPGSVEPPAALGQGFGSIELLTRSYTTAAQSATAQKSPPNTVITAEVLSHLLGSSDDDVATCHGFSNDCAVIESSMATREPCLPSTSAGGKSQQQQQQPSKLLADPSRQPHAPPSAAAGCPTANDQHASDATQGRQRNLSHVRAAAVPLQSPLPASQTARGDEQSPQRAKYAKAGQAGIGKRRTRPTPMPSHPECASVPPPAPPSRAQAAAAIFAIRCLHLAQPRDEGAPVRAYVPLSALHAMTSLIDSLAKEDLHIDVAAAVAAMREDDAFVVGALTRPVTGSSEFFVAARPRKVVAAADVEGEAVLSRETKYQLFSVLQSMKGLQSVLQDKSRQYGAAWELVRSSLGTMGADIPRLGAVRIGEQLSLLATEGADGVKEALEGRGPQWNSKAAVATRLKARGAIMETLTPQAVETETGTGAAETNESDSDLDTELMAGLSDFAHPGNDSGDQSDTECMHAETGISEVGAKHRQPDVRRRNSSGVTSASSLLGGNEALLLAGVTGKARQIVRRDLEERARQNQAKDAWLTAQSHARKGHPGAIDPSCRIRCEGKGAAGKTDDLAPAGSAAGEHLPSWQHERPTNELDKTVSSAIPADQIPGAKKSVPRQHGLQPTMKRLSRRNLQNELAPNQSHITTMEKRKEQQQGASHKPRAAGKRQRLKDQKSNAASNVPSSKAVHNVGDDFDTATWEAENAALIAAADAAMEDD